MTITSETGKPLIFCCRESRFRSPSVLEANDGEGEILLGGSDALMIELQRLPNEESRLKLLKDRYANKRFVLLFQSLEGWKKTSETSMVYLESLLKMAGVEYVIETFENIIKKAAVRSKFRI